MKSFCRSFLLTPIPSSLYGDKTYIVGSGMYGVTGPDIQKAFPGKTIYSVFADH
ncbi:MAG: hypothetical protein KAI40_04265 [Desulfobacterales bacterium]|nr:hypothetical protein [Desulfobacterales bacterium]